ncbi:MAG: ATP-binding protein [Elusimicrobiota bacterium]|nr:ATP-binding protein [Elusimicrobiota bacterium]
MKSLTDYWRTKFIELQKQFNEDKKKSDALWHSEKKELKDKIFEQTVKIQELQDKISGLEKTVSEKEKIISRIDPDKELIFENHKTETEKIKNENTENIRLIEQKNYDNETVLISEFVRFLKKDIGSINGQVWVLDEICKGKEAKKVIKNLIEHLEWMSQLADELSWFSQPFKKEEGLTDTAYLLEKVVGEFKDSSAAKNVKISVDIREKIQEISIFEAHLKTVFTEIIKNSLDAMPQGGLLVIKIYQSETGGVIEFSDTGRGIPAHLLEKVTKPFFSTKKKIGFGLGMTRVRKILDAYGYRLTITSEEDKGTTVMISTSTK